MNINFKTIIILVFLTSNCLAKGQSKGQYLEPHIGARTWYAKDSLHLGYEGGLKYLYSFNNFFIGLNAQYNSFNESFDDDLLMDTKWTGYNGTLLVGGFIKGYYIDIGYVAYDKISTDVTKQYVTENSIATINNFSATGKGYSLTVGAPVSDSFLMFIQYRLINYDKQKFDGVDESLPFDISINSLSLSIGLPFSI